jgi:hypothetical protein
MKAIRIHEFGPTEEVLQYEDVPAREPKAGVAARFSTTDYLPAKPEPFKKLDDIHKLVLEKSFKSRSAKYFPWRTPERSSATSKVAGTRQGRADDTKNRRK